MENQENNNLSELDQLKAQYETLKQKFDEQEIVNDKLMKSSIRKSADFFRRYRWLQLVMYPVLALVGLLFIKLELGNDISAHLFWMAFCLTCLVVELWMTRSFQCKKLKNNDLLTLSEDARTFKKLFSVFALMNYSTGIIVCFGLLLPFVGYEIPNLGAFMLILGLVAVVFVLIGMAEVRFKTKPCDDIIRQIEASGTPMDKKNGNNRKQKWVVVAMIVLFLGFDVWAYLLMASYLKLPPIKNTYYVRAADDFSTDSGLEIWEVYSKMTFFADSSNFCYFQDAENDTIIYRLSGQAAQQNICYAMKKIPAISSAILGGKPMIQRAVCGPYKEGTETAIIIWLTPEAAQLWQNFTENAMHRKGGVWAAVTLDGKVCQTWRIERTIDNGSFFINADANWTKDEVKAFCERIIRQ